MIALLQVGSHSCCSLNWNKTGQCSFTALTLLGSFKILVTKPLKQILDDMTTTVIYRYNIHKTIRGVGYLEYIGGIKAFDLYWKPRCTEHPPMYWTHIVQGDSFLGGWLFYSLLVTFCSLLVDFLLVTRYFYSLLVTFYSLLVTRCFSTSYFYSLLVTSFTPEFYSQLIILLSFVQLWTQ